MSRDSPRPKGLRTCRKCGVTKSVEEFYTHTNGKTNKEHRARRCKDCENSRERTPTTTRMVRNRARNRAYQALAEEYRERFHELYERELVVAKNEVELIAELARMRGDAQPEIARLKTGPKRAGQGVAERLDVARCSKCQNYHDRGHACPTCHQEEKTA